MSIPAALLLSFIR